MVALLAILMLSQAAGAEPRWESLFEADGGRWAVIEVDGRAFVWGRGRFDDAQAQTACAEAHRQTSGWRLPSQPELDLLPAESLLGVRLWVVENGTAVVFESLEGLEAPAETQPPTSDVICVREAN